MTGIEYFVFWIKLVALSLPFLLGGAMLQPFVPHFSVGITAAITALSIVFGFFIMVWCVDDDETFGTAKIIMRLGKVAFLCVCLFAIACILNLSMPSNQILRILWMPLTLIAAKVFFRIRFTETL